MRPNVKEAFKTLELDEASDLQAVKTAYKKLALLHHPDRNGDEEAFKRISNAFQTLSKHFEAPAPVGRHAHYHEFDIFELFNMFHFGMFPRYSRHNHEEADEIDSDNDDASTEYTIYSEDEASYYARVRHFNRRAHARYDSGHPDETDEQRRKRVLAALEEQKAAEERRKEEAKVAKEKLKKAKEAEQKEAASRRSAKTAAKRAAAKEKAEAAALQAAKRLKSKQEARSTLFTLLLSGPTLGATEDLLSTVQAAVKKDDVAVHGWEQLDSSLDMSDLGREPRKETLLHLAVKAGLLELANWLCDNGAILEERDDAGYTAFHHALFQGHLPLLDFFFESFPPIDEDGDQSDYSDMYEPPPSGSSLVHMAVTSRNPLALELVLEACTLGDIKTCYTYIEGQSKIEPENAQLWESMKGILAKRGKFKNKVSRHMQPGHPRPRVAHAPLSKNPTPLLPRGPAAQGHAPATLTPKRSKRAPSHSPELAKIRAPAKRA